MNGDDAYVLLLKKIKGILSSVSSVTVDGTTLKFVFTDGTSQTMTFPTPKDGVSVIGANDKGNGTFTLSFSDGTESDAIQTVKGEDGYTPVKGTDYWTEEDVAEIKAYINEQIGGALNGSY